jgi:hypothetical protein
MSDAWLAIVAEQELLVAAIVASRIAAVDRARKFDGVHPARVAHRLANIEADARRMAGVVRMG